MLAPAQRAAAQAIERPADDRPQLPTFETPEEQEPVLPPVEPPSAPLEQLTTGLGVFVERYDIEGSTVFTQAELQAAVAPWTNKTIRSEDLVDVRNALTKLYVEQGYVNSGAFLPDQDVQDGSVRLRIIEGSLEQLDISGNSQFRDSYLKQRIARGAKAPLNVHDLETRLQILQQDPQIERVTARLVPGEEPGDAVLKLDVEEASRWRTNLEFSNYEPPGIGALGGRFEGLFANPAGRGDMLRFLFHGTEGLRRYRGYYDIPFTPRDTRFSLDARYSSAEAVRSPGKELDIESSFQSYRIGLRQPVFHTPKELLEVEIIADWRHTTTELLGNGFSFPGSGAQDGEATAMVLRFVLDWLRRDRTQVLAARAQVSWGIDALGATINSGGKPDGQFVSWLAQLQWARRFGRMGIETLFRTDLQFSSAPLLTMEQIAAGGYATVRGYRQNQRVQDQAVIASIETRIPLWRHPQRWGVIQLAPFFDVAHLWDHHRRSERRPAKTLASVGVGLRWTMARYLSAQIYWGQNLTEVITSGTLQDKGVQFKIEARFP